MSTRREFLNELIAAVAALGYSVDLDDIREVPAEPAPVFAHTVELSVNKPERFGLNRFIARDSPGWMHEGNWMVLIQGPDGQIEALGTYSDKDGYPDKLLTQWKPTPQELNPES